MILDMVFVASIMSSSSYTYTNIKRHVFLEYMLSLFVQDWTGITPRESEMVYYIMLTFLAELTVDIGRARLGGSHSSLASKCVCVLGGGRVGASLIISKHNRRNCS